MTLPLLGPMSLDNFAHPWFFLFLLVIAGLVGLYVVVQFARQKRILRFANMELLEKVAPQRQSLAAPVGHPAGGVDGAADRGDGRTPERRPDPAQPRRGDADDRRLPVDARHRVSNRPRGGGARRRPSSSPTS